MAWNGTGTYILNALYSPEVNGTTIDATRYNGLMADLASGINNALAKDGQNAATGNLPMGGFKPTGLGAASAAGQALVYGQATDVWLDASLGLGTATPGVALDVEIPANSAGGVTTDPQTVIRLYWKEASQDLGVGEGVAIDFGCELVAESSPTVLIRLESYKLVTSDTNKGHGARLLVSADGTAADITNTVLNFENNLTQIDVAATAAGAGVGFIDVFGASTSSGDSTSAFRVCDPVTGNPSAQIIATSGNIQAGEGASTNCSYGFLARPDTGMNDPGTGALEFYSGLSSGVKTFEIDDFGNVILGAQAILATNTTDGFAFIPRCSGVPTGVPTAVAGKTPMIFDGSNDRLYLHDGSNWRYATLT